MPLCTATVISSQTDANFHHFGIGYGPTHNIMCTSQNPDDCIPVDTQSNLGCENYSQAIGVRCQLREDTCTAILTDTPTPAMTFTTNQPVNRDTTLASPSLNNSRVKISALETTDTDIDITTPAELSEANTSLLTSSTYADCVVMYSSGSSKALGVLTGLLAAALVIVTMGWIVTCVYWYRKIKRR